MKVSCSLLHRGVHLRLAYSWARPATLIVGKDRVGGDVFIYSVSLLSFLFLFLPCPSLSSPLPSLLSHFSLSLGDDTKWPTRVDVSLNPNSIKKKLSVYVILTLCIATDRTEQTVLTQIRRRGARRLIRVSTDCYASNSLLDTPPCSKIYLFRI